MRGAETSRLDPGLIETSLPTHRLLPVESEITSLTEPEFEPWLLTRMEAVSSSPMWAGSPVTAMSEEPAG